MDNYLRLGTSGGHIKLSAAASKHAGSESFTSRVNNIDTPSARCSMPCNMYEPELVLVYNVLHGLVPRYLGPLNYVADLPGRRPLPSASTLAVLQVKLATVANQPGFPGCRPTNMERSARRRDFSRIVRYPPYVSDLKLRLNVFSLIIPWTGLDLTSL